MLRGGWQDIAKNTCSCYINNPFINRFHLVITYAVSAEVKWEIHLMCS